MTIINSWMCPWLISAFGMNYASFDNAYVAMEMLAVVVVQHNLGNFTAASFAETVGGHRVELLAFTKFVLRTVGNTWFVHFFFLHSAATLTLIVAGKAIVVHHKDMSNALISLLTGV